MDEWLVDSYLNFGLGATIFKPAGDLDSKNKFSLSFGGGVKKFFNDRFGIRSQLRGFVTFLGSNDELYCDRFGCWTYEEVVNFTQFEISTGPDHPPVGSKYNEPVRAYKNGMASTARVCVGTRCYARRSHVAGVEPAHS